MRTPTSLLLLASSTLVPTIIAQSQTDEQTAASYEEQGICAYYYNDFGHTSLLTETCVKYCATQNDKGWAQCDVGVWERNGQDPADIHQIDEDGYVYAGTPCLCENPDGEAVQAFLLDTVIKGLGKIDEIICGVAVETCLAILETGIDLIPGGLELNAARRFVEGAKTFTENSLEAASFFDNWVGDACGIDNWNFDITSVFTSLVQAPDSYGTSKGCSKKNKADCKKLDPIPDNPKPTKKPEPTAAPTSKAPDASASKTSSSAAPTDTGLVACTIKEGVADTGGQFEGSIDPIALIGTIIGGINSGKNQQRSPHRAMLEERAKDKKASNRKSGNPCSKSDGNKDFVLQSGIFPSNGELDDDTASYGYKVQTSYCDYDWQNGTKAIAGNKYDSEHVLEWQIVTDFFAKLQTKLGTSFDSPEPDAEEDDKVDFCTYWIDTWGRDDEAPKFSLEANKPERTAWEHIATAYPSKEFHKAEMIRLQRQINAPAKSNLFTDTVPYVWNEDWTNRAVNKPGEKDGRGKVLERLRTLIGARTYLLEPAVMKIFKDQKERMGKMLDKLDTEMANHAPQKEDPVTGDMVSYKPWAKQNLLTEWNAHMDTKWDDAVAKFKKVFDKYIPALETKWCKGDVKKRSPADKQFCERLVKLQTNYNSVTTFSKPW